MGADETFTLPYLLELLSVKESGIDQIPMTPEAKKDRTIEALRQIVLKGSEVKPLIIGLEDLHWLDKSSEDAAKDLLDNISGSKVLLIFTYRPEFAPSWGVRTLKSLPRDTELVTAGFPCQDYLKDKSDRRSGEQRLDNSVKSAIIYIKFR